MPRKHELPKGPAAPPAIRKDGKRPNTLKPTYKGMRSLGRAVQMHYVDGLSIPECARALQVDDSTLKQWLKPFTFMCENYEQINHYKANEAQALDGIRYLLYQGMVEQLTDPERRRTVDLSRLTYGFGVVYDKTRLERGESTVNQLSLSELVRQAHARDVTPKEEAEVVEEPK
jgi:predicted DNA-binding protein YlxM (UPF0122 family)